MMFEPRMEVGAAPAVVAWPAADPQFPRIDPAPAPGREGRELPHPGTLSALGTVLCLFRPGWGTELEGWRRARTLAAWQRLDSDGLDECLCFFDREGQCCWRLHLLPDSDFLAWDRLLAGLPVLVEPPSASLGERLWRRLAGRLRSEVWSATALRLRATGPLGLELAASVAPVSELGRQVSQRIGRGEAV